MKDYSAFPGYYDIPETRATTSGGTMYVLSKDPLLMQAIRRHLGDFKYLWYLETYFESPKDLQVMINVEAFGFDANTHQQNIEPGTEIKDLPPFDYIKATLSKVDPRWDFTQRILLRIQIPPTREPTPEERNPNFKLTKT